jgi:RNA polymerase sigma-70 factor (sigma-E family)
MAGRPDREAEFTTYVAARRPHLRRTAFLICGDWHAAEDLVQVTLSKLYVAWPRLQNDVSPEAYARRTMVRAHIDETRRPWRRGESATADPPEQAARKGLPMEDRDALLTALASLPDGQRRAVVLRHWLGLSVEETAYDLGCSIGTVKSQTARAVTRLREALQEASPDLEDDYEHTR